MKLSSMNCFPTLVTAITRSTGGVSCMNVLFNVGKVVNFCARCHASSGVAYVLRNWPVIMLGLYRSSPQRS